MTVECPECGKEFKQLGQHWVMSDCDFPKLSEKEIEVIKGLLMGDASIIHKSGRNPYLSIASITKDYLLFLDEFFGCKSTGVSLYRTADESFKNNTSNFNTDRENYNDVYRLRTRSFPEIDRFSNWYKKSGKVYPQDLELTETSFKHWFVCDGSYNEESCRISIACSNEYGNKDKLLEIFSNSQIPKPDNIFQTSRKRNGYKVSIVWNSQKTYKIFNMIGNPLPGFEYKWASVERLNTVRDKV